MPFQQSVLVADVGPTCQLARLAQGFQERSFGTHTFATGFGPCHELGFIAYEIPAAYGLGAFGLLVADGTVCVHYFIIPLCHVRTLEIEPLVYAQVIARTIAVVCYLAFEQRFVTQLSGNFEQLVEVVVETESTVLDDVIGQCLHLCIVSFQQIDAGGNAWAVKAVTAPLCSIWLGRMRGSLSMA